MSAPHSFKAWTYSSFNGKLEDSLVLRDVDLPQRFSKPKPGNVLVQVLASSLNPADYKIPESAIESRVVGLRKPATPGLDFCGRIVSQPDRIVYGRLPWPDQYGTLGEYILVTEKDFADVPEGVDVMHAAAAPIAGLTAYQSLVPYVKKGDRVLCNGGSGGVGTMTIQIAKLLGCQVVTTCSARNAQLCKDLGADVVIDYTQGDIIEQLVGHGPFDIFIDNVGSDPTLHRRSSTILNPGGRFVIVSGMLSSFAGMCSMVESMLRPRWLGGPPNAYSVILCQPNKKQLQEIAEWISQKKLKIVIDEAFDFKDAPQAFSKLRTGRARGKIVVRGAERKA